MEKTQETPKVNENLKAFVERMFKDEDLASRMAACKSPEEAYALASSEQEGFTFEEFTEAMTALRDAYSQEISDEDLARAAGGVDTGVVIGSVSWSVMVTAPISYLVSGVVVESLAGAAV